MKYITVQHFYDSVNLAIARSKLENEGIKTITKDEQTTQTLSLIEARAVGGAKLQVEIEDYPRASQFMIELGFMKANDNPQDFWLIDQLDKLSKSIPVVNTLSKELRIVAISFLLVSIPFLIIFGMSILTFS